MLHAKKIFDLRNKLDELYLKRFPIDREIQRAEDEIRKLKESAEIDVRIENMTFIKQCQELDPYVDIYIDVEYDKDEFCAFEDDGGLFIRKGKVTACFINDQEISKSEWNKQARPILKHFNLKLS